MAINQTCDDTAPRCESTRATLLAAVVTADQMINSMTAMRAGLIDQLRTDALDPHELTLHPGDPELDLGEVTAELACALHLPHTTAAHLLDDAHALATLLPATAAALAEGTISYRHAQTMVTIFSTLDASQRARAEAILVPRAKVMTGRSEERRVGKECPV